MNIQTVKAHSATQAVIKNLALMVGIALAVSGLTLLGLTISGNGSHAATAAVLLIIGTAASIISGLALKHEFAYSHFHYSK